MRAKTHLMIMTALLALVWLPGTNAATSSGFLEDYSRLQPDGDRAGAKIWRKPGVDLGKYRSIGLDEIEMFVAPNSKYKGLSAEKLKTITDSFRRVIVDALEPDYPVVSKAGTNVLLVRLAISNVRLKKKKRNLLNFTPAGMVIRAAQSAVGKTVLLTDATIEAELRDSQTGEVLGLLVDSESAEGAGKASWDGLTTSLEFYAKRFRARLDAQRR